MLRALRNRLTIRLVGMFTVMLLLLAATLSIGGAALFSKAMNEQVYRAREDTMTQTEKNITTLTNQINSLFQMYELSLPLQKALRYSVTAQSLEEFKLVSDLQSRAFEYAMTSVRYGFDIILFGINGIFINNEKIIFNNDFEALTSNAWYQALSEDPDATVWLPGSAGVFEDPSRNTYFTVARLLTNPYSSQVYGVVMMRFRESSLYDIFEDQNPSDLICVVNAEGHILSSNRRSQIGGRLPVETLAIGTGGFEPRQLDEVGYMAASRDIPRTPLSLYVLTPQSEISRYSRQVLSMMAGVAVASVLLSVVLAVIFSRSLVKPLVGLIRRIRQRQGGIAPDDDLSLLTGEYEVLLDQLEATVMQLQQEQEKKRIMEFQMLQYQINPHFLYNTLSSIKALVWTGRTEMIEPVTDALVNLLENALSKSDEMTSLADSFRFLEDYLVIQRIRLNRNIVLDIRCTEPSLLQTPIPKLLLQPVVENSIFHGIEPTGQPGHITVEARRESDSLLIVIEDDGKGIDPMVAQHVFRPPEAETASPRHFSKIGVRNVRERILLYYGGRGNMTIGPRQPDGGTQVAITIPLE